MPKPKLLKIPEKASNFIIEPEEEEMEEISGDF